MAEGCDGSGLIPVRHPRRPHLPPNAEIPCPGCSACVDPGGFVESNERMLDALVRLGEALLDLMDRARLRLRGRSTDA